uniref:Uncharacterized protein n=1 Tax=Rhizophora mucronata TaxID=61149 RepID=A0A2P2K331_RHIMU
MKKKKGGKEACSENLTEQYLSNS